MSSRPVCSYGSQNGVYFLRAGSASRKVGLVRQKFRRARAHPLSKFLDPPLHIFHCSHTFNPANVHVPKGFPNFQSSSTNS